jgi:SAM-dependent methyltransferase
MGAPRVTHHPIDSLMPPVALAEAIRPKQVNPVELADRSLQLAHPRGGRRSTGQLKVGSRAKIATAGLLVLAGFGAWRERERLADWLTDSLVRRPTGWVGRRFFRNATPHQGSFRQTLDALALGPRDHLLEIGCGGGTFLEWALATGCTARAVDHSSQMVALAHERNTQAIQDGRLALYKADAAHLPFGDGQFTAAAMTNVFFFLYQPEAVLTEIRRTLAPGGRIAIYTDATAFMAPPFIAHRMRFYTDDQLRGVVQDAGYAAITVQRTGPGRRMQLVTARNFKQVLTSRLR